jgi:predicted chitinase
MTLTPQSLSDVMGGSLPLSRYAELLPAYNNAMLAAQCTTARRAAAWHSQVGHESLGLQYMAEIETSNPSWDADRTRYRGRGPIQLTWSSNYRRFGLWCQAQGYVSDSEVFVNQPELVEQPKWGFLAASWYWLNGGPKPGKINGYADAADIMSVSRCVNGWIDGKTPNGYPDRLDRWNRALAMGDAMMPNTEGIPDVADNRPDFNEINEIGLDRRADGTYGHASVRSRPPMNGFLHTQQGNGNATDLSRFLRSTSGSGAVSYHYTIHEDPNDHGVTVVDVVDTDLYSWSVLNANVFSINYCFAGSFVEFSRDEWLAKYRNAIRVAAYLMVQDARKYNYSTEVILPPYGNARQGLSDHRYVTKCLGIGDHQDVGGPMNSPWTNFPWDTFVGDVKFFDGGSAVTPLPVPTTPVPAPVKRFPDDWTDREINIEILRQLRGPSLTGWSQLGNKSIVDAIADLKKGV